MSRTKAGFVTKKRHKKIINFNKGFKGSHSRLFKTANQENIHSFSYAYEARKKKKADFRKLWIKRINNVAKTKSSTYSEIIKRLKLSKVELNRKILSKLAISDLFTFNIVTNCEA